MEHGFEAPTLLGIDDRITGSTRVLEDENVEKAQFREFIRRFSDDHPPSTTISSAPSQNQSNSSD